MLFVEVRGAQGTPGPTRGLELSCRFKWSAAMAVLRDALFTLSLGRGRQLAEVVRLPFVPRVLEKDCQWDEDLRFPLSLDAIRFVEESRTGGDVGFRLAWRTGAVEVAGPELTRPIAVGAFASFTDERRETIWEVPQSEWVKRLREFEWDEIEIFEISKLALESEKSLAEALKRMREAQQCLRRGDHRGVLAKVRAALESAAKHQVDGSVKQGFELLLDRAFPNDEPRKAHLTSVIKSLTEYMHKYGRHEEAPATHVPRSEAEFVFTTVLGLFSMLSRRLAGKEA